MIIEKDKAVSIDYTLKDSSGSIIDSSQGQEPLAYIHGIGNLIPGLEKELEGKTEGDKVSSVIQPEEAYGLRDDSLLQQVSMGNFDDPSIVQEGAQFQVETNDGIKIATVTDVAGEQVTIDLNHPLAGVELHFDVEVISIREATPEELSHGHIHGPGGHQH